MTKAAKKALDARFAQEMAETASDMHVLGVIDDATYKATMHDLNRVQPTGDAANGSDPATSE